MSEPRVSVIIPTYNRCQLVTEAINSVLKQTFSDYEIIVVDDGSVDKTGERLASRGKIKYVHGRHGGVSAARNRGIKEARGELIAFLDSDDLWLPGKLERQVAFFDDFQNISIVQTDEIWERNGRRLNPRLVHKKPSGHILRPSLYLCLVSPSAVMLRKEVFSSAGLFDEKLPVCEDYDFWLRSSLKFQIHLIPERLVIKRAGFPDQLSFRYWGMDRFRLKALGKLLREELPDDIREEAVRIFLRKRRILARGALKRKKIFRALFYRMYYRLPAADKKSITAHSS